MPTPEEIAESKRRHQEMTQLQVSHTLRAHNREWFGKVQALVNEGRPYIYASPVSPHEIYEALDIPSIPTAWYSGLVAARRQSAHFSNVLSERGYHNGLDRYGSLAFGTVLDEDHPDKPWGGLPKAAAVISSAQDGGADELARHWGVPYFGLEQPSRRTMHPNWWELCRWQWEDLEETDRIDLVVDQFNELIAFCETIAGKKLDLDRLREIMERVNEQESYFDEVREILATAPKLPARLGEVMSQVMGIQYHRGTEWGLAQARAFRDEVKMRADNRLWVCPNEKYRMMYVGAGLWQRLDFFASFEESHGVVFARSNYLSIASDGYVRHGLRDPVRALASRYTILARQMHIPPLGGAWAAWEARQHRIVGGLQLDRGRGAKWIGRRLEEEGVPVLDMPVDPVDGNKWDDAKVRAIVTEFIETRVIPAAERGPAQAFPVGKGFRSAAV